MVKARVFWEIIKKHGIRVFSGVPCSVLKDVIAVAIDDREVIYVPAVREDVALGIASSAYFCGGIGCVLMQNSGLGNIINPLTSFNMVYQIPVLIVTSWRGRRSDDAPEHQVIGRQLLPLLDSLQIHYEIPDEENLEESLMTLIDYMCKEGIPSMLIVKEELLE
jgi:phosphonopyruvate decarboxylase